MHKCVRPEHQGERKRKCWKRDCTHKSLEVCGNCVNEMLHGKFPQHVRKNGED